jgi:putative transposase
MLDEIALEGARAMLAAALEREVQTYVESFSGEVDADGHRLVVRNGHANARVVKTAAGPIEVATPRVNDRRVDRSRALVNGSRQRFCRHGRVRHRR